MSPHSKSPSTVPQRALGATGQSVSCLGLGCASYWAKPRFAENKARAVVETALASGITLFDTGASYAAGHAEQRLGRLLRELDADPDALLIGTKVGTISDVRGRLRKDFDPNSIIEQTEQSLKRLGLEQVGLIQLHGPEPTDLTDELLTALEQLKQQGKARLIGINANDRIIQHAIAREPFDVLMPFISLLEPDHKQLARHAADAGQAVLAAGPLARMLFAPPLASWLTRPSGLWYLARALRHPRSMRWRKMRALHSILKHQGWTSAQLALAWILEQPGISSAVFGTTKPEHVSELTAASQRALPSAIRQKLLNFLADDPEFTR
ncbi:MAG: aldo/keto reductase [Pseudomonadota bacterium]